MSLITPSKTKIAKWLDLLAETQERQAALDTLFIQLVEDDPEIQDVRTAMVKIQQEMAEIREDIKTAVLEHGETIRGERLQAVWCKGRVSWDIKALEGYAAAHPEILSLKSEGQPTIQFRKV